MNRLTYIGMAIAGVVYDPSGAVVPNATIQLLGTETGEVARTARPGARVVFRNFVGWTEVPERWRNVIRTAGVKVE